ncbi:hypothetical protein JL722_11510 [Aureococcus anophagefferens]|nr:hypothetical protein JL722_11510 [Aureococcus anophagefferens]
MAGIATLAAEAAAASVARFHAEAAAARGGGRAPPPGAGDVRLERYNAASRLWHTLAAPAAPPAAAGAERPPPRRRGAAEAPDDDLDAYDDDDDDAYEEDASVEAPDERGVSGESGDDDDDDDGLKIYDDCDDDDDDASFDEPDLEPKPKPKRTRDDSVPWRTTKTWTGGTFDEKALDDHLELLSEDGSEWTGGGGYSQKCSDRIIIKKCLWVKKLNCPCQVRVVHPADRPGVTYLQERLGHVHNFDIEMKTSKTLPVKIREIVAPMVLMTTAPKHKIWQLLEAKGVDVVNDFPATTDNIAQVQGYIRRMRKKGKGKNAGTMGGLSQFLEDHLVGLDEVDELDDEHRVFVLDGSVIDADSKTILLGMGYPFFFVGTVDAQQRYHIVAGWLLKSENKDDITVIYDKTLSYVEALAPFEREQMRHSMEDNCDAIFSAVAAHLPGVENPGNCYFHLMKNVRSKKNRFTSEEAYNGFMSDLRDDFKDWDAFQAEYVDGDKGHWQQAKFAPQQPTTNVAQESFMNTFKNNGTHRELAPVDDFLTRTSDYFALTSKMDVCFAESVRLEQDDWRVAQQSLVKKGETMSKKSKLALAAALKAYAAIATKPCETDFNRELDGLDDFDSLRGVMKQAYHLAPLTPTEAKPFAGVRWQCSCNNFWHYGKCKHSLAWAISRGEMTADFEAIYDHEWAKIDQSERPQAEHLTHLKTKTAALLARATTSAANQDSTDSTGK